MPSSEKDWRVRETYLRRVAASGFSVVGHSGGVACFDGSAQSRITRQRLLDVSCGDRTVAEMVIKIDVVALAVEAFRESLDVCQVIRLVVYLFVRRWKPCLNIITHIRHQKAQ